MRKVSILFVLFLTIFSLSIFAQPATPADLSQLLGYYYNIKNSLVDNDANGAAASAELFLKVAHSMDHHLLDEGDLHALVLDAVSISETRDLKKQRTLFCNLSANMGVVAHTNRLSSNTIFKQYCPLRKASWLSNDRTIKNPLHALSKVNCDEVIEIIQ